MARAPSAVGPEALSGFDPLAGLHIRETLQGLHLDPDRWRLVDLRPPQKSRRINRAGRTLTITPELLICGTTGIGRPLGDPDKVTQYLARGEAGKLTRRLESDVKALYAFYRRALQAGAPVDIVVGSARGWADPWSRARRVEVVQIEPRVVTVREGAEMVPIDRLYNNDRLRAAGTVTKRLATVDTGAGVANMLHSGYANDSAAGAAQPD